MHMHSKHQLSTVVTSEEAKRGVASGRALIVSVKIYFLKNIYANIKYMECALVITDAIGHANIQDVLTSNAQKYALCFAQEGGD